MVNIPSDLNDSILVAAMLQSDDVVRILQREFKQLYPSLNFSQEQILDLLRKKVLRDGLLDENKLNSATEVLAQAKAASFAKRATRTTGSFKAVPSKDAEEDVHDMWHDKTMASGGG